MPSETDPPRDVYAGLERLVGVYHADGTLLGELTYFVQARLGRTHCALCDITHGLVSERADWRRCRDALAVPFETYHRNDQPEGARAASSDTTPVVVAELAGGTWITVLGPEALDACDGSPDALITAIEAALSALD